MADFVTVQLTYPIEIKTASGVKQKVSELTIGRIKAKHLKLFPKSIFEVAPGKKRVSGVKPDEIVPLVAGLTGITEEEADEIDVDDLLILFDKISVLLDGVMGEAESPKTGTK